jgi:hypothetical protein
MRYTEFKTLKITEGDNSNATRFNSEVGMLAAMCGVNPDTFDPLNPAPSFEAGNGLYTIGDETIQNIINNAKDFKQDKFNKWVKVAGPKIHKRILDELESLGYPVPTELSWVGGQNQSSVADVKFVNHVMDGISVKEQGAPTLANLTAKSMGLDGEDPDIFRQHAREEWDAVKQYVFDKVIEIAKSQPGKAFAPSKAKYSITYMTGEVPADAERLKAPKEPKASAELDNIKKNAGLPAQEVQPEVEPSPEEELPLIPEPEDEEPNQYSQELPPRYLSESVDGSGYFIIKFDEKIVHEPEDRIMLDLHRNAKWQRVFGDYFQSHWKKDATLTHLGSRLFAKIGVDFVHKIKQALADDSKIHSAVKMGDVSYFYATPSHLYYVPAVNQNRGLKLHDLKYDTPKGTNQFFTATIGYENETPASVLIYIRYANGIFKENPTVRVQKLTNAEGLGWINLYKSAKKD